jgi:hypothetical protein
MIIERKGKRSVKAIIKKEMRFMATSIGDQRNGFSGWFLLYRDPLLERDRLARNLL